MTRLEWLHTEYTRLWDHHETLQREHENLKQVPDIDRAAHFRRLELHRQDLRGFGDHLHAVDDKPLDGYLK